ncbi:MAG: hypothetical protein JRF63_10150 [Deltaproteobacteria bacterium]|nr:hypothetical protein [Deltaproteobacteria bacterium]
MSGAMNFCRKCGEPIPESGDEYCGRCGRTLVPKDPDRVAFAATEPVPVVKEEDLPSASPPPTSAPEAPTEPTPEANEEPVSPKSPAEPEPASPKPPAKAGKKRSVGKTLLVVFAVIVLLAGGAGALAYFMFPEQLERLGIPTGRPTVPRALAVLGPMVSPTPIAARSTVSSSGGLLQLDDGTGLNFPQGALARPLEVSVRRYDLELEALTMAYSDSFAHVITAADHVPSLGAPVTFELPYAPADVAVLRLDGPERATRVDLGDGPKARIQITHFSERAFVTLDKRDTTEPKRTDPRAANQVRNIDQRANDAARNFYGVGDTQSRSHQELCNEIWELLDRYPNQDYGYPSSSILGFRSMELGRFLHANGMPSQSGEGDGAYFWKLTENRMGDIRQRLLASPEPVTPAGMLHICLDSYAGAVPMALLACHNFLKENTMQGRMYDHRPHEMPAEYGEVGAKLQTWRSTDKSPAGFYDKMGPLYHLFAANAAGVWGPNAVGAEVARWGEWMLRQLGSQGDVQDKEKGLADSCGANLAYRIRWRAAQNAVGLQPVPAQQPQPPPPEPPAAEPELQCPPPSPGKTGGKCEKDSECAEGYVCIWEYGVFHKCVQICDGPTVKRTYTLGCRCNEEEGYVVSVSDPCSPGYLLHCEKPAQQPGAN